METRSRRRICVTLCAAVAAAAVISSAPAHLLAQRNVFSAAEVGRAMPFEPAGISSDATGESCLLRGRPVHDFKLRNVVNGRMTTFLETVRRDYTFLYYLNAGSVNSLESLSILERLRDRYRDRVGLVAIFLDPATEGDILRFLIYHELYPDFALHDPSFHQARCYGFAQVPALHVIGPQGEIVFTVTSSRPVDLAAFTARLDHVLAMQQVGGSNLAEAREIYDAALSWLEEGRRRMALFYLQRVLELQPHLYTVNCQIADIYRDLKMRREAAHYYSRYIGANSYAYDLDQVRASLKSLQGLPAGDALAE